MANLCLNLTNSAQQHPARTAIRLHDATWTYAQLDDASARVASVLVSQGVQVGDRVALMLPNVPEFAVLYYGILRAGAVAVPLNPLLKAREVEFYLADSGAVLLAGWHDLNEDAAVGAKSSGAAYQQVAPGEFDELLATVAPSTMIVERDGSDTAAVLYTSGATGRPKGVELTHGGLNRNQQLTASTLLELTHTDVVMGCLPLFQAFGMTCCLNATISAGATLTLLPHFDARAALRMIERDHVTILPGIPRMYAAMLELAQGGHPEVPSLRLCVSGGATLPAGVMSEFEQAFNTTILEGYGVPETSPVASFNHPRLQRKPGSIGTPIAGVEMRVIDALGLPLPVGSVGEIAIRGHNVMKGYWNQADATSASIKNGWFLTGDLAHVDEQGYFYLVGRKTGSDHRRRAHRLSA